MFRSMMRFFNPFDLLKLLEGKLYDKAAEAWSHYANHVNNKNPRIRAIIDQERLEMRREIRQRGTNGPAGPTDEDWQKLEAEGLDYQTAYGKGPLVLTFCEDDEVPLDVWRLFIRIKD